ncbi:MAG TPA: class I SAM-dependent methyltransferase [Pyrinomonadaceae bacterium]|nr:class I SAM-dependent methyltransferase [Pyrinomonadaceae bacterium]
MQEAQTIIDTEREPAPIAHVAIHETVERILSEEKRGSLLDVPAGEGALAVRLQKLGFKVACSDLYPQIFRLKNAEIRQGNLDATLPYEDDSFDYAVCVEGLEHIENPANAIREFRRVLKPNGQIVISVPNILNIEERLKWLIFGYTSHFKPISAESLAAIREEFGSMEEIALHVNPIGYSELRYLLEKNGFVLRKVYLDKPKKNSWAFFPIIGLIRLIQLFTPEKKRRERWTSELNSNEVLLGGNTLIVHAILK